jgi:CheY-like chemotaxis protein
VRGAEKRAEKLMKIRMSPLFDFSEKGGAGAHSSATAKSFSTDAGKPATESARTAAAEIMADGGKSKMQDGPREYRPSTAVNHNGKQERRHKRRVKISAPVCVRQVNVQHAAEFDLTMTSDVSREGLLFETSRASYQRGQEVAIVFPYRPMPGDLVREQRGQVVRVVRASESRFGVAVAFIEGPPTHELLDSGGNLVREEAGPPPARARSGEKPLVIVVEADQNARAMLRSEIEMQGYAVETVPDPSLATALLRHRNPAVLMCEAEAFPGVMPGGGEMSGYDLCVIVRRNAKLARLPVILTTRTGLPSDFATAHALGATVCVAKPYDLARVANLLRMLAPVE